MIAKLGAHYAATSMGLLQKAREKAHSLIYGSYVCDGVGQVL